MKPIILRSLPVNSPLFTLHAVFILKSIKKKNLDNSGIYFLFFFNNLTIVADKIILRIYLVFITSNVDIHFFSIFFFN